MLLIALVALLVLIPAMRRNPGLGVVAGLAVVGLVLWQRGEGLAAIGLIPPTDWAGTIQSSLFFGALLALLSQMLIDPLVERLTGKPHDISAVEGIRGNLVALLSILLAVWVLVALVEEVLFRGFMMNELARVLGAGIPALAFNLLVTSALFGLSHWYQGPSGVWSTGILGALLGLLFISSGFNLWLPILAHGVIDTILLAFIYLNIDEKLKHFLIR